MTTTLDTKFQVNLDSETGATAIHVDSKETLERIEAFKANLDAKKMMGEEDDEEEMDDEDEEEMPVIKGKKGLLPWLKKKDSTEALERHDSDVLRAYLDSEEEPEIPEFEEGDDMDEVLDSLLTVIQHKDNKLAVAAELLSRQDSGQAYDVEAEVQARVDSLMTAFFDANAHLPQGFSYEPGMTGGDIYAEAISHIDSDLADEIGVTQAEDSTLQAAFKALTRGGRTDSKSSRSQNDQINAALNGSDSVPMHISRMDAEDASLPPWERQRIRDYQASRAPIN
jgi:hypothetical protein